MQKTVIYLIALILFLGLAPTSVAQANTWRIHPQLLAMSKAEPTARLPIIVQKQTTNRQIETLVEQLGGIITLDLSIINGFAAEVPAGALPTLATATGMKWISFDAPMIETGGPDGTVRTSNLRTVYNQAIRADQLWAQGYQGSSVGVAVLDSGIDLAAPDLSNHVSVLLGGADWYGHGTHVAGIIAGNGAYARGKYIGVAPKAKLVDVSFASRDGQISASYLINAIQLILQYKNHYNIRVVNLSFNSTVAESYLTSPLSAAVQILWFNGIVVVASAGNNGTATLYPPANDPFVITVGAADDKGTASITDDTVAPFSAYGTTADGFAKPDLVAPGRHIVSLLASNSAFQTERPGNIVDTNYFRMSGTSAAAPMVAGAIALLLQDEPNLTPDQVKYRLMATANKNWSGYTNTKAGAGYLDAYAAVHGTTTQSANIGIRASQLLWTGSTPVTWNSVSWNSVSWNSVSWNSVSWNSVSWNSVSWNSDYWESAPTSARNDSAGALLTGEETTTEGEDNLIPPERAPLTETTEEGTAQRYTVLLPLVTR